MQFSGLKRTAEPAAEPLTLAEAKEFLRVDHDDEDTFITTLIQAARESAENYTGRALIDQSWTMTAKSIPSTGLKLLPSPIGSITSFDYLDADDQATYNAWTDYHVDLFADPARVFLTDTPSDLSSRPQAWRIVFQAGYGATSADVPESIIHGIKLILGFIYNYRTHNSDGFPEIPPAAMWILNPYRVLET